MNAEFILYGQELRKLKPAGNYKRHKWLNVFTFVSKPESSDDDEESLFNVIKHGVHFPDDDNDLHNDSSLEILEYDTSISEKVCHIKR